MTRPELNSRPPARITDLNGLPVSTLLGSYRVDFLYWGHLGQRWWRNYLHVHSYYEVCLAYEGAGTFRAPDGLHEIETGTLFVAKPREAHEIISSKGRRLGIYFFAFSVTPQSSAQSTDEMDVLLDSMERSVKWVVPGQVSVRQTCELLTEEVIRREAGLLNMVQRLAGKLVVDIARAIRTTPLLSAPIDPPAKSPADATARRIKSYLRDNLSRPISIRDIAAQVHLSERHAARVFSGVVGMSAMDYLTQIRVDEAARMLLNPELSIKEIALACGYPDVHYFTTLFGKKMGITPAVFRGQGGTRFLKGRPPSR